MAEHVTKPCVFPCKVAAGDDERYLVCATGAAGVGLSFFLPQCNGGLKLLWVCLCVHSYRVFWNLRLQSALEWLHDSCHLVLLCVLIRAGLRRDAAKRIVMVASRLLGAAAACVILVSFAGEDCKSYWSGGIQAAIVICQQIGASNFPFQNPFTGCFKIVFFLLWRRDPVLELQFPTPLRAVLLCFATQSLQIAL